MRRPDALVCVEVRGRYAGKAERFGKYSGDDAPLLRQARPPMLESRFEVDACPVMARVVLYNAVSRSRAGGSFESEICR